MRLQRGRRPRDRLRARRCGWPSNWICAARVSIPKIDGCRWGCSHKKRESACDYAESKKDPWSRDIREMCFPETGDRLMGYLAEIGKIESVDGMHPVRGSRTRVILPPTSKMGFWSFPAVLVQ